MTKASKRDNQQLDGPATDRKDPRSEGGLAPDQQEWVAERAYERFQARGGEHGHDQEDWFEAEREVNGGAS